MNQIFESKNKSENQKQTRKLGWRMFSISLIVLIFIGPFFAPAAFFGGAFAIGGIIILLILI